MLDINLYNNSNTVEDIKNYLITHFDNNLFKKIDFLTNQMQIKSHAFRSNLHEYYSNYHLSILCEYYITKYWILLSKHNHFINEDLNTN